MRSRFARTLLGLLCLAGSAGFALPPIFIRNTSDQPWLLGTEASIDALEIRIEAPGEPVSRRSGCLEGPIPIPPGAEATLHLLPPSGPRDVSLRLHRGLEPAAVPNALVTFSFSPERSAVHVRCLPAEPLQSQDATLTIGRGGPVHASSPAAPAPATPAGTEASQGPGRRVHLPSPAAPAPAATAGSSHPQASAPAAGAEAFEILNASKDPGVTWYLRWSATAGCEPGLRITGASGKISKRGKREYALGIKPGERVALTRTGAVADVKRLGLYSYDSEREIIYNPHRAGLALYDGAGRFAPAVHLTEGRPAVLPYQLEGNVLTLNGAWLRVESEAERRTKRARAWAASRAEPAAAARLLALLAGTGGEASPGSAAHASRLEGEVVLVNPEANASTWWLRWEGDAGEGPGVVFSERGSALPTRTPNRNRKTREIPLPPGHRVTLRPTGGLRDLKRIMVYSRCKGGVMNPFKASLDLTFQGADSRVEVHCRRAGLSTPPYLITGNVLTFTRRSWEQAGTESPDLPTDARAMVPAAPAPPEPGRTGGEAPAGKKRKASSEPAPDAPTPAAAGTPVAATRPRLTFNGKVPRLEADPPLALPALPPPAVPSYRPGATAPR